MASISYGTHMPRTDWGVMRNFTVMLPQVQEQRAIAEVLSDVDGLLNALEALIAKKRAIKQATMQQLLTGKTRLPGFSGAWETKQGWENSVHIKTGGLSETTKYKVENGGGNAHFVTFRSAIVEQINSYCFDDRHSDSCSRVKVWR